MAGTRRLDQLVDDVSDRVRLPDGPLILGLSGGADSAALGYLCGAKGRELRAVHINHGLVHSSIMEKAATEIAETLGIALDVVAIDVPRGASPEGQARRARYRAFADVRGRLLTAHTRDDVVETVLFNLIRGTGSRGMAGIPYFRAHNIYRPILEVGRSETREIAFLAGLPFADDPMNEDPGLSRNIIRRRVIPVLSEMNPGLAGSVARMSSAISKDNQFLDQQAARVSLHIGDRSVAVAVGDLLTTPEPVADRVLKTMLTRSVGGRGLTAERVQTMWRVARGEVDKWEIESDVVVRRDGAMLVLESPLDHLDNQSVRLTHGTHRLGALEFEVVRGAGRCPVFPLSRWSAVFPAGAHLVAMPDGTVTADGDLAWVPGSRRYPVGWYVPGSDGYLSVSAREVTGWTSSR